MSNYMYNCYWSCKMLWSSL